MSSSLWPNAPVTRILPQDEHVSEQTLALTDGLEKPNPTTPYSVQGFGGSRFAQAGETRLPPSGWLEPRSHHFGPNTKPLLFNLFVLLDVTAACSIRFLL